MSCIYFLIRRLDLTYRMLSSLVSTYLERVSFEVALTSEQSNKVQEKFNAVGTILLPLLVIQGMHFMCAYVCHYVSWVIPVYVHANVRVLVYVFFSLCACACACKGVCFCTCVHACIFYLLRTLPISKLLLCF